MIRLGGTGLFICKSDERPRLSRSEAEAVLGRCLADESIMHSLRSLLGFDSAELTDRLDDQRVLAELAAKIENGELLLFGELVPAFAGGGASKRATHAAGPAPRTPRAPAPQPPVEEDPSLFTSGTDLAALADAIQGAAQTGAPFCEH